MTNTPPTHPSQIGERLILLREALGYSQAQFARLLGITAPALANYEAGERRPQLDQAFKIKARLGVPIDWIYFGDETGMPKSVMDALVEFIHRKA